MKLIKNSVNFGKYLLSLVCTDKSQVRRDLLLISLKQRDILFLEKRPGGGCSLQFRTSKR